MEGKRDKKVVIYSEAFKRKVIEEVKSGEISQSSAQRKYGIGGKMTIKKWLERSKKMETEKDIKRETVEKELLELEKLKSEKQQLESALAQAHLKILTLETIIELAEEHYGEPIKKNSDLEQLKG
jgi:transposase-like protein